jgi:hypothetical protein
LFGKGRIASAEDHVATEVDVELLLECLPDVDFREDTESFCLEGFGNLPNGAVEGLVLQRFLISIAELAHDASLLLGGAG